MLTKFELLQVFVRYNVFTGNKQSKSVLSFYKSILLFISFCYFSNCNLNWNRKINQWGKNVDNNSTANLLHINNPYTPSKTLAAASYDLHKSKTKFVLFKTFFCMDSNPRTFQIALRGGGNRESEILLGELFYQLVGI